MQSLYRPQCSRLELAFSKTATGRILQPSSLSPPPSGPLYSGLSLKHVFIFPFWFCCFESTVFGAASPLEHWSEILILGFTPDWFWNSGLKVGPAICFSQVFRWLWCARFKNQCFTWYFNTSTLRGESMCILAEDLESRQLSQVPDESFSSSEISSQVKDTERVKATVFIWLSYLSLLSPLLLDSDPIKPQ